MKKLAKINRVVRNFVQSIADIDEVEMDKEFCLLHNFNRNGFIEDAKLTYSLLVDDSDYQFLENAFRLGLEYEYSVFTISLLHEIGHFFTLENFPKNERKAYNRAVQVIEVSENRKLITAKEANARYFELPIEKVATLWAIDYANNHYEKLVAFEQKMGRLLAK